MLILNDGKDFDGFSNFQLTGSGANARILANNLDCFEDNATSLLQCLQVNRPIFINGIETDLPIHISE